MEFFSQSWGAVEWNALISSLPGAHLLQTWQWGQVKVPNGWQPERWAWRNAQGNVAAAAQVLQRDLGIAGLATRLRVLYVPRGPVCDWQDATLRRQVLDDLGQLAQQRGAIFVKIDPEVYLGMGVPGQPDASENEVGHAVLADLQVRGWHLSDEQIQFRNTMWVDLRPDLDSLLARMKQKTRYNIRLAERKGVTVRLAGLADLANLYRMYAETSARDGFVIRDQEYYLSVWSTFMRSGMAEPLVAEVEGQAVAGVVIFRFAQRAWYINGMSALAHREKMPNYLLQWEAMRRAKAAGCQVYDLWGAPDVFDENDTLWGVYRFKEGLGGQVMRGLGAWDLPVRRVVYRLYTQTLPRILDIMRRRGKERTRRMVT
jgi:lipid II:glycine glycyltransferase (peptidoglycan interpeptide bridge formation enzyme)